MIPKYNEMYKALLETLKDKKEYSTKEYRNKVAKLMNISDEEREILLDSGGGNKYNTALNWTSVYLKKAKLIESTKRGVLKITERGLELLATNPNVIDNHTLKNYEEFREFLNPKGNNKEFKEEKGQNIEEETPQDILEKSFNKINKILQEEVLEEVMRKDPYFFESLVVKLLQKIGYGTLKNSGKVTKKNNDEGIDGIINQDKLGFDCIYIQAKKWDKDSTVSRPEIQKFVGALAGQGATKGLFITTAKFSDGAREYSQKQHTTKIVLIDGMELAKLMIEYNLGVSVENVYEIKKIDSDFFEELD
ncbi:restriction endonuclease [Fusobacterium perfoetens]|uniref:restriction endonuclease n=1 Tax=Fusobacterium perfoetens TaxID=852 RepID=UPI001F317E81|nr:restriction endonuclease [Fusobacterium perfoetens]MCF2612814.1 restriction endonuclease [Fusobacterium perfoetens]